MGIFMKFFTTFFIGEEKKRHRCLLNFSYSMRTV